MNRKGSGIPQPSGSSGIPRRAPSPSSAAFGSSSGIPRRAPSPANAAFSSAAAGSNGGVGAGGGSGGSGSSAGAATAGMTPSRSAGPMGGYRPSSRGPTSDAGDASFRSINTPSTASRFGFASASGSGRPSVGMAASHGHKRSSSAAGFTGDESSLDGPPKRPLLTGTNGGAATPSPRFPAPSPAQDREKFEAELEKQRLLHEARYAQLEKENRGLAREIERFHGERAKLLKQWDESQEGISEERDAFNEDRKRLEALVKQLSASSGDMQQKLDEAETQRAQTSQSSHKQTTELEAKAAELTSQLAMATAEAQRANEGQQRLQREMEQREAEWADEKARSDSSTAQQPSEDSKKLTEQLSGLMQHVRKLEAENGGLKADNKLLKGRVESIETLKEQKRDLENKVGVLDELRRRCAEGETRIASLEKERDEWTQRLSNGDPSLVESTHASYLGLTNEVPAIEAPSPLTVKTLPRYISLLQGAVSGLSKRCEGLSEQLSSARSRCDDSDDLVEKLRLRIKSVEGQLDDERLGRRKGEKTAENLKLEVDSYKRLLETYQEEAKNASSPAQYDGATAERIQMLDARVEELRAEVEASNKELEQMRAKSLDSAGGLSASEARKMEEEFEMRGKEAVKALAEEKRRAAELEQECTRLGQEVDSLYLRVGRGEFDQSKLRCLEMTNNPVSRDRVIRNTTLDALTKENEELVKQLEEVSKRATLSASNGQGSDGAAPPGLVPVQTLENHKVEYQKLEQAMKDRDKAFARLKEAFGAKAAEYVAAVKALFGYDMHVVSRGKVKLRSVYARSSRGTSLTFNSEEGDVGNMRLMGEARQGMANVNHLRSYWLGDARQSVPCFLAALQLELYESTTRAIRTTWEATEE